MPRHYPPDRKAAALEALQANGGDIVATHLQTGIAQRTLYTWRSELWMQQVKRRQRQPPPPPKELPETGDVIERLDHIRQIIVRTITELPPNLASLPPYLMRDRVAAQVGLVDILLKLNAFLGVPEPEEQELRITFISDPHPS